MFNIIQPHLLAEKFINLNVSPKLIVWFIDFLVNKSQVVRYRNVLYQGNTTSTGAPQGIVLSPILLILHILFDTLNACEE